MISPRLRWCAGSLLPLAGWIAMILVVATRPSASLISPRLTSALGVPRELLQYPYHVGAFGVLAVLFARAVRAFGPPRSRVVAVALLGTVVVSITSELLQFWAPTRTPAVRDLLLDFAGGSLGLGVLRLVAPPRGAA